MSHSQTWMVTLTVLVLDSCEYTLRRSKLLKRAFCCRYVCVCVCVCVCHTALAVVIFVLKRCLQLVEVVMDLGRVPVVRFPAGDMNLTDEPVTAEDLGHAVSMVSSQQQ